MLVRSKYMANEIQIEIAQGQELRMQQVPSGSTIRDVVGKDVVGDNHPAVGIFGKLRSYDYVLQDGDRIEIYQPLLLDPKEARRERVRLEKVKRSRSKSSIEELP